MNSKKWIRIWFFKIIIIISFIGGFNYIVDPFDAFENKFLKKYKYRDRISSSIKLSKNQYDTIIIGTSRTKAGVSTLNSNLKGKAINISMSGSNVFEIHKVFNKIYKTQKNQIDILYGLDFLTFNDKRFPGEEFQQSLYSDNPKYDELVLSLLFSFDVTKASIKTIILNTKNSKQETIYIDGYQNKNVLKDYDYINAFNQILSNNFLVNEETYGCYNYGIDRLKLFEDIVSDSKNNNLILFINPLHVRHIFALKHLGLFDEYINWIKDIHNVVKKYENRENYNIMLYDFSYINNITTEPVTNDMKYYWESSHYKSIIGDKILDSIYNNKTDFGVLLNHKDIVDYLNKYINSYYDYVIKNQEEYLDIYSLYVDSTDRRVNNCEKYNTIQTILKKEKHYSPIKKLAYEKQKAIELILNSSI